MKVEVRKEEVWPVYYENEEDKMFTITAELDINPRLWEDYKMARDKFMKLQSKVRNADNSY